MLNEDERAHLLDDLMKYQIKTACIQMADGGLITVNRPGGKDE